MGKRLTPNQKQQYVVKQILTAKEINRLETNPNARWISQSEMEALLDVSRAKTPA